MCTSECGGCLHTGVQAPGSDLSKRYCSVVCPVRADRRSSAASKVRSAADSQPHVYILRWWGCEQHEQQITCIKDGALTSTHDLPVYPLSRVAPTAFRPRPVLAHSDHESNLFEYANGPVRASRVQSNSVNMALQGKISKRGSPRQEPPTGAQVESQSCKAAAGGHDYGNGV